MTTALDPGVVELVDPEGDLTARFAVHAGMVGCSLRHRGDELDRKSTRLNSSHLGISYAVFCLIGRASCRERV